MSQFKNEVKRNARALKWMGLALLLELTVLVASYISIATGALPESVVALMMVALPAAVLTVFLPGLREARGQSWGILAFWLLVVGVAVGLVSISGQFYSGVELTATIVIGLIGLAITAIVSLVDA